MSGPSEGTGPGSRPFASPAPPWDTSGRQQPPAPWEAGHGSPAAGQAHVAQTTNRQGTRPIAILLAAAAVAAAVVGLRASSIAGQASGDWQTAVRLEVKRSTSAQETVRYMYNVEVPLAITIVRARLVLAQLDQIPAAGGPADIPVAIEKSVQTEILKALEPSSELTGAGYSLDSGGVDLGKRLADLRAQTADDLKIDPDSVQAPGDALAAKSLRMSLVLGFFGLCGLLGAMAGPFKRWSRRLLEAGTVSLIAGIAVAVAVEVLT